MIPKEKCCFLFCNGERGEKFVGELQERLCGVRVKGYYCYAGYIVDVDRTVY